MNEFQVYEQLCILKNIAGQYRHGKETEDRLEKLANDISSRMYRVAVIGEFKRGKSSLINALIGSKILPTDILPMTASVTRVKYGEKKKITVCYKSGRQEEKTIRELINYATKFDAQRQRISESIREVRVDYPSVLCKNNIEFLDTPGMNDDEKMSEITLGVLGDVDAAIMVISADSPLSVTEQDLILRMIGKRGIRHIIFAVTHIDAVSDEPDEQDRILDAIRKRISANLLSRGEKTFQDDEYLAEKAKGILSSPDLFGVSSTWAMAGFIADDAKKLKQSRLPEFKQELLDLLTAAQSMDAKEKAMDAVNGVEGAIGDWFEKEYKELKQEKQDLSRLHRAYTVFFEQSQKKLVTLLTETDRDLRGTGMFQEDSAGMEELYKKARRVFIENLSKIRENTNTNGDIYNALSASFSSVNEMVEAFNHEAEAESDKALGKLYKSYQTLRPCHTESRGECVLPLLLALKVCRKRREASLPKLCIPTELLRLENLVGISLIDLIEDMLKRAIAEYCREAERYIAAWRALFLQHNMALLQNDGIRKTIGNEISDIEARMNYMRVNVENDRAKIQASKGRLNGDN